MSSTIAFDIVARDRASSTFDKFGKSVEGSGESVDKTSDKLGGLTKVVGTVVGAVGGAALVFRGLGQALDNEVSADRMAAALGSTPKVAEKMGRISSRLYAGAWGESMDEVGRSVESVASSFDGLSAGGLQKVSRQAMDFAKIFDTEVPRATMVAATVVESGLAKNATAAFDLMTAAAQRVPSALRENVFDAAEEYGSFFSGLGFDGEQAFAMLAKGAEKGQYGIDKVGDAIKEFSIRATDGSKASTDAYKAIGVDADEMATKIVKGGKGAARATSEIVGGLLNIKDPAKQAQTAIALFGTPLEDLNVKDIPDFLRSMQKGTEGMDNWRGSIDKAGETLNDNASSRITAFKRSLETTFVELLGGKVIPFVEEHKEGVKELAPALAVVAAGMATYKAVTIAAAAATAIQTAGTVGATGATWSLNAALRANPIGIVITALTALGAGFVLAYKKSETFRTVVDGALSGVKKGIEALGKAGTWLWNSALQPAFKFIISGVASILDLWSSMLSTLAKVPGFGWAEKAAEAMGKAADKARDVADGIKKIPNKTVTVTVAYKYTGRKNGVGGTRSDDPLDPSGYLGRGQMVMTTQAATAKFFDALADGMKKGGKKLDAVLDASRTRLRDKLGGIRDEMKSMASSVASALNQVDFGGSLSEHLASLTGTNGALTNLMAVFEKLKSSVSKEYLSALMQSGNIGLATALANDPAAAAQASALYDSNAAMAQGLGDQTAQQVMGDKLEKALRDELGKLGRELKDSPSKTARELRKEIQNLRIELTGGSAGQRAYLRGAGG